METEVNVNRMYTAKKIQIALEKYPNLAEELNKRYCLISQKGTDFSIVKYGTDNDIQAILNLLQPTHYAYIYHDKDDKEPHWHILIVLPKKELAGGILRVCDVNGQNTMLQLTRNRYDAYCYLIHQGQADKHQYSPKERISDDEQWWEEQKKLYDENGEETEKSIRCVEDLISQKYTARELLYRYGRDFLINRRAYEEMAQIIAWQQKTTFLTMEQQAQQNEKLERDRQLLNAYRTEYCLRTEEQRDMIREDQNTVKMNTKLENIF